MYKVRRKLSPSIWSTYWRKAFSHRKSRNKPYSLLQGPNDQLNSKYQIIEKAHISKENDKNTHEQVHVYARIYIYKYAQFIHIHVCPKNSTLLSGRRGPCKKNKIHQAKILFWNGGESIKKSRTTHQLEWFLRQRNKRLWTEIIALRSYSSPR